MICATRIRTATEHFCPGSAYPQPGFFLSWEPLTRALLMRFSICSAPGSPPAFACRITFAVEGEIFVNSGLTYRFFDFEVVDAVFALDGESMTYLFLMGELPLERAYRLRRFDNTIRVVLFQKPNNPSDPVNFWVIPYVWYRI